MPKPTVDTTSYWLVHFRGPSGRGYWAFVFEHKHGMTKEPWSPPGEKLLYSEARKLAIARAQDLGAHTITVVP